MNDNTNRLIHSSSPYLQQHAHNPVDWYPWGEDAFQKAKKEKKLLIISIGYSSCHWCHVMEKETFEDSLSASVMNQHFVSIKVDREERPDIDQVYMDAAHLMTGRGGWPLNVICNTDGKPIYAGTYFPQKQWIKTLKEIVNWSNSHPKQMEEQIKEIFEHLQSIDTDYKNANAKFDKKTYLNWENTISHSLDYEWGGSIGAPKFPMPVVQQFLMATNDNINQYRWSDYIRNTLNRMANGGIYDHIGNGFARYSTDKFWKVPHFEKMLYDNAQLMELYAFASHQFNDARFKSVVMALYDFLDKEMQDRSGLYYSSYDADSEGEEGKFYLWTYEELNFLTKEELTFLERFFTIKPRGNWERKNIFMLKDEQRGIFYEHDNAIKWQSLQQKLYVERSKRVPPFLDKKCITSWNLLALKAIAHASFFLDKKDWLQIAQKKTRMIIEKMLDGNHLYRIYNDGEVSISGFLEDYALLIELLIALYQIDLNPYWIEKAKELMHYTIQNYSDKQTLFFHFSGGKNEELFHKSIDLSDNVIPSSNSIMAHNLLYLGQLFDDKEWITRAKKMLLHVTPKITQSPLFYANWLRLYHTMLNESFEVAVVGENATKMLSELRKKQMYGVLFYGAENSENTHFPLLKNRWVDGKTMIYVCQNQTCQFPTEKVDRALSLIQKMKK